MIRLYILPIIEVNQVRNPKYFYSFQGTPNPGDIICRWGMIDYGSINMGMVAADIQQTDHDFLVLQTDVYVPPENIDTSMTVTERSTMNTYLEAHAIPGDWLSPGDTFRSALRVVAGMFLYLQRTLAIIGYPSDPFAGLTLNTQYRNIPNPLHDAMHQAALDLGYVWGVSDNDQIRKIWKMMSEQWGNAPIHMGVTTL